MVPRSILPFPLVLLEPNSNLVLPRPIPKELADVCEVDSRLGFLPTHPGLQRLEAVYVYLSLVLQDLAQEGEAVGSGRAHRLHALPPRPLLPEHGGEEARVAQRARLHGRELVGESLRVPNTPDLEPLLGQELAGSVGHFVDRDRGGHVVAAAGSEQVLGLLLPPEPRSPNGVLLPPLGPLHRQPEQLQPGVLAADEGSGEPLHPPDLAQEATYAQREAVDLVGEKLLEHVGGGVSPAHLQPAPAPDEERLEGRVGSDEEVRVPTSDGVGLAQFPPPVKASAWAAQTSVVTFESSPQPPVCALQQPSCADSNPLRRRNCAANA